MKKNRYLKRRLAKSTVSLQDFRESMVKLSKQLGGEVLNWHPKKPQNVGCKIQIDYNSRITVCAYLPPFGWSPDFGSVEEVVNHFKNKKIIQESPIIEAIA